MNVSAPTFGEFLRQLRRRAGLTQGELAVIVGFSVAQISRLEKDERLPDVPMVIEKFLPALALEDEPRLAQRLLELAAAARGERAPTMVVAQREVRTVVQEVVVASGPTLPATLLPLIGRAEDVAVISKRIMEAPGRLLTLIGPPGVGKTQLAMTVAAKVQPLFLDGAYFVPLAAVTDPEHVPVAIVAGVGLTESDHKTPRARLIEHLRRKSTLLVLDNFEQVSAAAPMVADLLGECPGLRVLVTSQEPLRLRTEQRQRVPPLSPAAAVELFFQRAQAIDPDFDTLAQAAIVTAICLRLDCLPLAIELVAAQLELLTPAQVLARLQDHALDLLADGPRDLPAHQRTLRNAIHRSYALLDEREQRLFRALGVFAGGCTVAALAAVLQGSDQSAARTESADELLRDLRTLVRKSLVQQQAANPTTAGATSSGQQERFTLLTTLAAYAGEQLAAAGEGNAERRSHAVYYLTLTQETPQTLLEAPKKAWLDQLAAEHDNLRVALAWSLQHEPPLALALAAGLGEFWAIRGHDYAARRWFEQVLAVNPAPTATRAAVLLMAANLARRQADYTVAQTLMAESLTIYGALQDQAGLAHAQREAGWLEYDLHRQQPTIEHFRTSLALYRQLGNQSRVADLLLCLARVMIGQPAYSDEMANALNESLTLYRSLGETEGASQVLQLQGEMEMLVGHYAVAEAHFREVLALWRGLDDRLHVAWAVALVGEAAWVQNHLADARICYDEAYQIFAELGNKEGCAILRHHQGQVARRQGAFAIAQERYQEALILSQSLQNQHMVARSLAGLGGVALALGEAERATTLLSAAQARFAQLAPFLPPADETEFNGLIETAQQTLPQEKYAAAWQAGQPMTTAEVVALPQLINQTA
ncbi:MAG: XRE family transcriptional regulator [Caldilinea sp. CFX5]|nr:XRE family transcriptional regulator [Caldilinea sp. CFX5]